MTQTVTMVYLYFLCFTGNTMHAVDAYKQLQIGPYQTINECMIGAYQVKNAVGNVSNDGRPLVIYPTCLFRDVY